MRERTGIECEEKGPVKGRRGRDRVRGGGERIGSEKMEEGEGRRRGRG